MKTINNALIKDYTTYKLEGKIKKIVFPLNAYELIDEIRKLKNKKYKIIGNGSNLIIDEAYNGILIKLKYFDEIKFDLNIVTVGAGFSLIKLVRLCADMGLSGLEFACGIPASVGGAIYMNAGAYGYEIKDFIESVTIIDDDLSVKVLNNADLKTSYRDSIFKHNNYIILSAKFKLKYGDKNDILTKINEIMATRREKQPLDYPSAGSVFCNPPGYSAGRLVEKSGLKGLKVGGAEVSLKHGNFIINKGLANARDVICLINIVKDKIKKDYGINLEVEQEILK